MHCYIMILQFAEAFLFSAVLKPCCWKADIRSKRSPLSKKHTTMHFPILSSRMFISNKVYLIEVWLPTVPSNKDHL